MNASTYLDWSIFHAKAFGLRSEQDAEMLSVWIGAFERAGFTVPELFEASNWMLTEQAPRFREQHLDMIQKRVTFKRGESHRVSVLAAQRREEHSRCMHCDNIGLVIVPHPQFFTDGVWSTPWPTAAVTCLCQKGEKSKRDAEERKAPMMSLSQYESEHPDWHEQVEAQKRTREVLQEARSHTRYVDKSLDASGAFGKVLKRVG